ncbi:thioredoxin family protein [Pedobacter sp. BAL39]|uniref:TlpA disulfide reductase family protein n=1 Tax=Pedobacter sp. BAL39 TaxID=391596 RepID=UPI000155949F|nr:TlpA disulfide reductase family protein [Pedobacter sp. BAL39]EDM38838.1 thioredoxin family protein [Pedobacter sp. BAL39]
MKIKLNSLMMLLLTILISHNIAAAAPAPFTITGSIQGLPDGIKLKLVPGATHADEQAIATTVVTKGKFTFKSTVDGIRFFYIMAAEIPGATSVMVQPGKITMTGKAALVGNENQYYDFTDVVVKGSQAHLAYLKKKAPKFMLDSLFEANQQSNKEVTEKVNQAYQKKDTVLVKQLKESAAWKKLSDDESAFFKLAGESLNKIVSDNKDSWWGPFFALDLFNYFTPKDKEVYASLSQQAKDSYYGKVLGELVNPVGFKGKPAPLVDLKGDAGLATDLASLTKGHKYVLVDFWASWCVPCRKSIPQLKKTYEELKDKGLQIVSISIDKKEADWAKAQTEEQLPWPSLLDKGATSNAWKIQAIPAMFLLDENGVVVAENLSLEEMVASMKGM